MKNWIIGVILVIISMILGMYWGLTSMRIDWLQAIMVFFTIYGMLVILIASVKKPPLLKKDSSYQPYASLIVPARNEEAVIGRTIRSLMNIDYHKDGKPNFEVIIMDDGSIDDTLERARALALEYDNLRVIHRGPDVAGKGKSDVLNHGTREAKGEVIGVFDADTEVVPGFLKECMVLLADPSVGGIQGRVRLYNRDTNLLSGLQEDEFAVVSHLYQIGKDHIGGLTALGGNGQLVKREALKDVDGWNYMSPTEDLDLTFKFLFKGWDVHYAPEAVLHQEGVETTYAFIRQRVRWAEGFLKCIFDYTVPLFTSKVSFAKKIDGLMTMGRVLIPFYVWIAYVFVLLQIYRGLEFRTGISSDILTIATWCFFGVMTLGMARVLYPNPLKAFWRVLLYSVYGSFWAIAIPVGFVNCIRNINDIRWAKTIHNGSSGAGKKPGVSEEIPAATLEGNYSKTGALS